MASGRLGRIGGIAVQFSKQLNIPGFRMELEYPALLDMAIHHFDLVRFITGKNCESIYAVNSRSPWSWVKGDPVVCCIARMNDQVLLDYAGTYVARGKETSWIGQIEVYGERGSAYLGGGSEMEENEVGLFHEDGKRESISLVTMERTGLAYALHEFCEARNHSREPECAFHDNLMSFLMVMGALESIRARKSVDLLELHRQLTA